MMSAHVILGGAAALLATFTFASDAHALEGLSVGAIGAERVAGGAAALALAGLAGFLRRQRVGSVAG